MLTRHSLLTCRFASAGLFLSVMVGSAAADSTPIGLQATPRPWTWSVVYKADVLGADSPRTLAALDNLNAQLDVDAGALFG